MLTLVSYAAVNEDNVAPAVEEVETPEPLETDYLPFESSQLTANVIANLTSYNLTDVELFDFQDATEEALERRAGRRCKAYPGDPSWPSSGIWWLFNLLSGLALIDGIPPAAVCYPDWPQYDEVKCEAITTNWTTPQYQ